MKIKNCILNGKAVLSVAVLIVITVLLQSCTSKIRFGISPVVPAAEGTVKVKKDRNSNYNIEINLTGLADANRLTPPKEMYIVWMESDGNRTKNIGQINTSSSMLSRTMKSSFTTVSSLKPSKIFITAEDDATVQYPAGQMVLSTEIF